MTIQVRAQQVGCVLNTAELPTLGVLQDQNLWEGWLREASSYNTRGFANGLRNLSYTLSVSLRKLASSV